MSGTIPTHEEIRDLEFVDPFVRRCREIQRMLGLSEEETLRLMVVTIRDRANHLEELYKHEIETRPFPRPFPPTIL